MIKRLLLLFFRGGEFKVWIISGSSSLLPAPFPSRRGSQFGSGKALTQAAPQAREWFFGALQGHFSLLIKKTPQKTNSRIKGLRKFPAPGTCLSKTAQRPRALPARPAPQAPAFWGAGGHKEHLAAAEVGKAPQAPAPRSTQGWRNISGLRDHQDGGAEAETSVQSQRWVMEKRNCPFAAGLAALSGLLLSL